MSRVRGIPRRRIVAAAGRPIDEIDATTLSVLRVAVHQLARMRVPAHAAVHESIELLGRDSTLARIDAAR